MLRADSKRFLRSCYAGYSARFAALRRITDTTVFTDYCALLRLGLRSTAEDFVPIWDRRMREREGRDMRSRRDFLARITLLFYSE
jgi:hypothetical protein